MGIQAAKLFRILKYHVIVLVLWLVIAGISARYDPVLRIFFSVFLFLCVLSHHRELFYSAVLLALLILWEILLFCLYCIWEEETLVVVGIIRDDGLSFAFANLALQYFRFLKTYRALSL